MKAWEKESEMGRLLFFFLKMFSFFSKFFQCFILFFPSASFSMRAKSFSYVTLHFLTEKKSIKASIWCLFTLTHIHIKKYIASQEMGKSIFRGQKGKNFLLFKRKSKNKCKRGKAHSLMMASHNIIWCFIFILYINVCTVIHTAFTLSLTPFLNVNEFLSFLLKV